MILSKEVEVRLSSANISYYENLGYQIPREKSKSKTNKGNLIVSKGTKIIIKAEHLPPKSHTKIKIQCDYCGTTFDRDYCDHTYIIEKESIRKDACQECGKKKFHETMNLKYGVTSPFELSEVREKTKETFIEKYGVENPFELESVKEQIKQTNLEKYGVEFYTQTEEYKERVIRTNLERYGVDNPSKNEDVLKKIKDIHNERFGMYYSQTDEFKEKYKNTCMEKYGVENSFQSEEVKNKIVDFNMNAYGVSHPMKDKNIAKKRIKKGMKTKYRNGTAPSSRQQEYIGKLFNGEVNFPVDNIWLDIKLNNTTFLEYDGSGHELRVSIGGMSQEKFDNEEMRRKYFLASKGWREIRIISKKDLLPSDIVIRHLVEYSMKYLDSGHSWIKFDIDNNKIICSQYEKTYDFGDLRKITEEDLSSIA